MISMETYFITVAVRRKVDNTGLDLRDRIPLAVPECTRNRLLATVDEVSLRHRKIIILLIAYISN